MKFFLFDPSNDSWKNSTTQKIEQNLGEVIQKFDSESTVILRVQDEKSDIIKFIQTHKLTSNQFRGLTILKDQYILGSLEAGHLLDKEDYDMGALFRILTQNDQSFFSKSNDLRSEVTKDTLSMEYSEKIEFVKNLEPSEFCQLQDCVIHIFDN